MIFEGGDATCLTRANPKSRRCNEALAESFCEGFVLRNSFFPRGLAKQAEQPAIKVVTVSVALLALWPFANPITADAKPITEAEKRHCEQAYHKYCGEYGLESNALRNCMSRNGRALPHACVEALIDAGEVSRSEVERRKKSGK